MSEEYAKKVTRSKRIPSSARKGRVLKVDGNEVQLSLPIPNQPSPRNSRIGASHRTKLMFEVSHVCMAGGVEEVVGSTDDDCLRPGSETELPAAPPVN